MQCFRLSGRYTACNKSSIRWTFLLRLVQGYVYKSDEWEHEGSDRSASWSTNYIDSIPLIGNTVYNEIAREWDIIPKEKSISKMIEI